MVEIISTAICTYDTCVSARPAGTSWCHQQQQYIAGDVAAAALSQPTPTCPAPSATHTTALPFFSSTVPTYDSSFSRLNGTSGIKHTSTTPALTSTRNRWSGCHAFATVQPGSHVVYLMDSKADCSVWRGGPGLACCVCAKGCCTPKQHRATPTMPSLLMTTNQPPPVHLLMVHTQPVTPSSSVHITTI